MPAAHLAEREDVPIPGAKPLSSGTTKVRDAWTLESVGTVGETRYIEQGLRKSSSTIPQQKITLAIATTRPPHRHQRMGEYAKKMIRGEPSLTSEDFAVEVERQTTEEMTTEAEHPLVGAEAQTIAAQSGSTSGSKANDLGAGLGALSDPALKCDSMGTVTSRGKWRVIVPNQCSDNASDRDDEEDDSSDSSAESLFVSLFGHHTVPRNAARSKNTSGSKTAKCADNTRNRDGEEDESVAESLSISLYGHAVRGIADDECCSTSGSESNYSGRISHDGGDGNFSAGSFDSYISKSEVSIIASLAHEAQIRRSRSNVSDCKPGQPSSSDMSLDALQRREFLGDALLSMTLKELEDVLFSNGCVDEGRVDFDRLEELLRDLEGEKVATQNEKVSEIGAKTMECDASLAGETSIAQSIKVRVGLRYHHGYRH